ncbi:hypothetical protein [Thermosipho affectus]|nr:hypothetical protein [Thermosipho affectus]
MDTGKNRRNFAGTFQTRGRWYSTTTWIVLVQSIILIGVTFEASGVIFFMGDEITNQASQIIQEWLKQPVITLLYEGPDDLKFYVENYFYKRGYLIGIGEPVYIFLKRKDDAIAWKFRYKDIEKDNFLSLSYSLDDLFQSLDKVFEKKNIPKKSIAFDPIKENFYIVENVFKPFVIKHMENMYKVKVGSEIRYIKEGFYDFYGNVVYIGKDTKIENVQSFVSGIYLFGSFVYDGRKLILGKKSIDFPELPIFASEKRIISQHYWYEKILEKNKVSVLDVFNNFALYSDGSLSDLERTWKYKFSDVPFDWFVSGNLLALAFVNGDVVVFDLSKRRVLYKEKFKKLYGVGYGKYLYVNADKKLFRIDIWSKKKEDISEISDDFLIEDGKVKFVRGIVIRPRYKMVWFDGDFFHFKDVKFKNYLNLLYDEKEYFIITLDGTWRIKR